MTDQIRWMSTKEAAEHLGVTLRSLYRFIDEGTLGAYKFGRVIRLKQEDVDRFIDACRIPPGSLEHLYPELKGSAAAAARQGANGAGAVGGPGVVGGQGAGTGTSSGSAQAASGPGGGEEGR